MSFLRPLRDQLFKYRKRKRISIDGSVPGMPHERYLRFTTPGLSRPRTPTGRYRHDLYMGDNPTTYRPNMFSPAVDWTEYQQEEEDFTPVLRTPPIHQPRDLTLPEHPLPRRPSDELSMTEEFLMNVGVSPWPQEDPVPVDFEEIRHLLEGVRTSLSALDTPSQQEYELSDPFEEGMDSQLHTKGAENDVSPDLGQITKALWFLENRLPHDHPDILNLKQAQLELGRQQLAEMWQDPKFLEIYDSFDDTWHSNLGVGDPYENDDIAEIKPEFAEMMEAGSPQQAVIDVSDVLEQPYSEVLPEEPAFWEVQDLQQSVFTEEMPEETLLSEPSLEEVVEQEFMDLQSQQDGMVMPMSEGDSRAEVTALGNEQTEQFMGLEVFDINQAFDEINQAMDQAAAFEQPEMDPWKEQDDLYNQMSMMMDRQMQYMANPFQMPGPMGPGYGPMGPMPGPM